MIHFFSSYQHTISISVSHNSSLVKPACKPKFVSESDSAFPAPAGADRSGWASPEGLGECSAILKGEGQKQKGSRELSCNWLKGMAAEVLVAAEVRRSQCGCRGVGIYATY